MSFDSGMRILIVDDDEAFRQMLARAFLRRGLVPLQAASAEAAREALRQSQPEACVLDLRIGQDSGLQLLPELLRIAPALDVVVLTGYASIATAVEAVKRGALDYLPKPADADEILAALRGERAGAPEVVQDILPMSVDRLEWEHIQKVLAEHGGNISETARSLGMHRRTLQRKLQKRPVRR